MSKAAAPSPGAPVPDRERLVMEAMRSLKLSQFRALGLLSAHQSVDRAARQSNEKYSSVKAQLHALNRWSENNLRVSLVSRSSDGRYELTPAGKAVAAYVVKLEATLRDMIDASGSPEVRVNIPCTSNCLEPFVQVRDAMADDGDDGDLARMEVAFYDVPSAAFGPFDERRVITPVLSFGSLYCRQERLDIPGDVDQLILDEDPIVAISNDPEMRWPEECTVQDLLNMTPKILMPAGGLVWSFVNDYADDKLWPLINGTHVPVHDLHFGLRALSVRAEHRAVMLVHGIEEDLRRKDERYPMLEDLQVIRLKESHSMGPRAVTGLFYNRRAAAQRDRKFQRACERFWAAARETLHARLIEGEGNVT